MTYALNDAAGERMHKLTIDEMPKHHHVQGSESFYHEAGGGWLIGYKQYVNPGDVPSYYEQNTYDTGKDQPHNTMMPYRALHWLMKQ